MKQLILFGLAIATVSTLLVSCSSDNTITANPSFAYAKGEVYTYDYYQRNIDNQRVDSTKRKRTWTVLQTDATAAMGAPAGQQNVTMIKDDLYNEDGTTIASTDTIFVSAQEDGEFYEYDMLGVAASRFDSQLLDTALSQIPKQWSKIGSTRDASALSWTSAASFLDSVFIPVGATTLSGTIEGSARADHKGKTDIAVPNGDYPTAYATDHSIMITATVSAFTAIDDSLKMHVALDLNDGLLMQSMDSKNVPINIPGIPGIPDSAPVIGFDMELVSITR